MIVLFIDEVNCDSRNCVASMEYGFMDMKAVHSPSAMTWEQRGMRIDDAVTECSDRSGTEELHVSGEHNEVDRVFMEATQDRSVADRGVGEVRATDVGVRYAGISCEAKNRSIGVVADDDRRLSVEPTFAVGVDNSLCVAAAMGGEEAQSEHTQLLSRDGSSRSVPITLHSIVSV